MRFGVRHWRDERRTVSLTARRNQVLVIVRVGILRHRWILVFRW